MHKTKLDRLKHLLDFQGLLIVGGVGRGKVLYHGKMKFH